MPRSTRCSPRKSSPRRGGGRPNRRGDDGNAPRRSGDRHRGEGLKAAQAAGVPVELEGPKPPASALAVTKTGFGPEAVAPPRPARPPKPVASGTPFGGQGGGEAPAAPAGASRKPSCTHGSTAGQARRGPSTGSAAATALSADQLSQPPVAADQTAPEQDPAFNRSPAVSKRVAADKRAHPTAGIAGPAGAEAAAWPE